MKRYLIVLLIIGLSLGTGFWLGHRSESGSLEPIMNSSARQTYVCPMHSHIVQDHPGACPICGMDLVRTGESSAGAQIHVDTSTQQKFGVRLASAEVVPMAREIQTYATLVADAGNSHRITPTVDGVLVKLHATRTGQRIPADEPLYEIFSQELLQLQNEYVDYFKRRTQSLSSADETRTRNRQMLESMHGQDAAGRAEFDKGMRQTEEQIEAMLLPMSRDGERLTARLKLAGFTNTMLQKLVEKGRAQEVVTIRAQHTCTVSEVSARAGMSVSSMTDLLTCAESDRAWLEVVFYPDQASQVHEGDTLKVQFTDGDNVQVKLTGLSAFAEGSTRTLRARIPFKLNSGRQLGDYADVTLISAPFTALSVPAGAVIRTGHGNIVMRALENGHFMPQKVETGIANDSRIVIRDGLKAGDKVAVNGQFLLDAAASIADAAQRYEQNATTK